MLKLTKTGIGLLTRQYRSVLKKCWAINVGVFSLMGKAVASVAKGAANTIGGTLTAFGVNVMDGFSVMQAFKRGLINSVLNGFGMGKSAPTVAGTLSAFGVNVMDGILLNLQSKKFVTLKALPVAVVAATIIATVPTTAESATITINSGETKNFSELAVSSRDKIVNYGTLNIDRETSQNGVAIRYVDISGTGTTNINTNISDHLNIGGIFDYNSSSSYNNVNLNGITVTAIDISSGGGVNFGGRWYVNSITGNGYFDLSKYYFWAADSLIYASSSSNSGTYTITNVGSLDRPNSAGTYKYVVLNAAGTTLALGGTAASYSDSWTQTSTTRDRIAASTDWSTTYYERTTKTPLRMTLSVDNSDSVIKYLVRNVSATGPTNEDDTPLGDTLMLVNQDTTNSTKTFSTTQGTSDSPYTYEADVTPGTTKGKLTVRGASSSGSLINLKGKTGFNLSNSGTSLTLKDMGLYNAGSYSVYLSSSNAALNVNGATIGGSSINSTGSYGITGTAGTVNFTGTNTVYVPVTFTGTTNITGGTTTLTNYYQGSNTSKLNITGGTLNLNEGSNGYVRSTNLGVMKNTGGTFNITAQIGDSGTDTFTLASNSSGIITLAGYKANGTLTNGQTYTLLSGTGASASNGAYLDLAQSVRPTSPTTVNATTYWNDTVSGGAGFDLTDNKLGVIYRSGTVDALAAVNQATSPATKTFSTSSSSETYTAGDTPGTTKGKLTVQGASSKGSKINLNGNTGFDLSNFGTSLTLEKMALYNADSYSVNLSNPNATLNVNGARISGSEYNKIGSYGITGTAGTVNFTGTNYINVPVTFSGTKKVKSGTTTFNGEVNGFTNNGTVNVGASNLTGAATNNGTLNLKSGTLSENISGTGTTKVADGQSVTNNATISSALNNAGTLTNSATISGATTNTGTLDNNGTLSGTVNNSGTLMTKADALTGSSVTNTGTLELEGGNLTASLNSVGNGRGIMKLMSNKTELLGATATGSLYFGDSDDYVNSIAKTINTTNPSSTAIATEAAVAAALASARGLDDTYIKIKDGVKFVNGQGFVTSSTPAQAYGAGSIAIGDSSVAGVNTDTGHATAVGSNSTARGQASSAFGDTNTARGWYSSAVGFNNTAGGQYSSAFGAKSNAAKSYTTAIGYQAVANEEVLLDSNDNPTQGIISVGHKDGDPKGTAAEDGTYTSDYFSKIINVADGTDAHDAVTKGQLDAAIAGVSGGGANYTEGTGISIADNTISLDSNYLNNNYYRKNKKSEILGRFEGWKKTTFNTLSQNSAKKYAQTFIPIFT